MTQVESTAVQLVQVLPLRKAPLTQVRWTEAEEQVTARALASLQSEQLVALRK